MYKYRKEMQFCLYFISSPILKIKLYFYLNFLQNIIRLLRIERDRGEGGYIHPWPQKKEIFYLVKLSKHNLSGVYWYSYIYVKSFFQHCFESDSLFIFYIQTDSDLCWKQHSTYWTALSLNFSMIGKLELDVYFLRDNKSWRFIKKMV